MGAESAKPVQSATLTFQLESRLSRFIVQAFAGGFLSSFAHHPKLAIREFDGKAKVTDGSIEPASLRLRIKAASLELIDRTSDRDRHELERTMREEVLEVEKYPEVVYEGTAKSFSKRGDGQYAVNIEGKLALHGVTRSHALSARMAINNDRLRAFGEFTLNQTDYNIKLVRVAGGAIRLKDELKFSFDLVGHRQG